MEKYTKPAAQLRAGGAGVSPHRTVLEPDKTKCPSGYTNFSKRLIMVYPAMFDVNPKEQYQLTKAVLCHEAGHLRFFTPSMLPSHVHLVATFWKTSGSKG